MKINWLQLISQLLHVGVQIASAHATGQTQQILTTVGPIVEGVVDTVAGQKA